MKDLKFEPSGVLIVNKSSGMTSHDVIGKIRRLYGLRRVGHTGTLDPMATGVLVVLVGRAAKAAEYRMTDKKSYTATLRLGIVTDTGDVTGTVLSTSSNITSDTELQAVLPRFCGEIKQVPSMYSAIKVNGQKLVNLARRGITVEREARKITIYSLQAFATDTPSDYRLEVTCSGGTYIRSLCEDIGAALGCGGTMASLCRTETGGFGIEKSKTIEELADLSEQERLDLLLPVESLFETLPFLRVVGFHEKLLRSGCAVLQTKLKTELPLGSRVRLQDADGRFFGLGEAVESSEGLALKSIKLFVL